MSLILRAAVVTDPGLVRANNEDCGYAGEHLLVVADGIGGMPAGEFASDIVVRTLSRLESAARARTLAGGPVPALRGALAEANRDIGRHARQTADHEGMGTTVTALLLDGDELGLIHVGDSRCYRFGDGEITQLTRDDTYVQSLIDQGLLSAAEARRHPHRSVVMQAVQGEEFTATELVLVPRLGDRYLLCSDGLSDVVEDEAIGRELAKQDDLDKCAQRLMELALAAGGPDNVTAVVAELVDGCSRFRK